MADHAAIGSFALAAADANASARAVIQREQDAATDGATETEAVTTAAAQRTGRAGNEQTAVDMRIELDLVHLTVFTRLEVINARVERDAETEVAITIAGVVRAGADANFRNTEINRNAFALNFHHTPPFLLMDVSRRRLEMSPREHVGKT